MTQVPYEPSEAGPNEVRRELSQRLNKLTIYIAIGLFLFAALAIVVDQRVHEDIDRENELRADGERAERQAASARTTLSQVNTSFFRELGQVTKMMEQSRPAKDPSRIVPEAADHAAFEEALVDAPALADMPVATREARFADARNRLTILSHKAKGAYDRPKKLFDTFVRHAYAYLHAYKDAAEAKRSLKEAQRERQTVPTPFGEFQMKPKVALVSIALLASVCYVLLALETRHILLLAALARGTAPMLAPVWLYSEDADHQRILGWTTKNDRGRFLSAVLVHGLWLALTVWLAGECFRTRVTEDVRFLPPTPMIVAIVGGAVAAVLTFVYQFFPSRMDTALATTRRTTATVVGSPITRRAAAASVVLAAVGAVAWSVLRRPKPRRKGPFLVRAAAVNTNLTLAAQQRLVQNAVTGTVHHIAACANHLPRKKSSSADGDWIHPGREIAVIYAVARELYAATFALPGARKNATDVERAEFDARRRQLVALLEEGIKIQPSSYHLHDLLAGIHGRTQDFAEISRMLQAGLTRLEYEAGQAKSPLLRRKIAKAQAELGKRFKIAQSRERERTSRRAVSVSGETAARFGRATSGFDS